MIGKTYMYPKQGQPGQYSSYVPQRSASSQPYEAAYAYMQQFSQPMSAQQTNQVTQQLATRQRPPQIQTEPQDVASMLAASSFAEQTGFDKVVDRPLSWILEVTWRHPLPSRWESHMDPNYNEYYFVNVDDSSSTWVHPFTPYVKQLLAIARFYRSGEFCMHSTDTLAHLKKQLEEQLASWFGPFTAEQGQYFVNNSTQLSTWEDPRGDAQVIHELQVSVIGRLQRDFPLRQVSKNVKFPVFEGGYLAGKSEPESSSTPKFGMTGSSQSSPADRSGSFGSALLPPSSNRSTPSPEKKSKPPAFPALMSTATGQAIQAIPLSPSASPTVSPPERRPTAMNDDQEDELGVTLRGSQFTERLSLEVSSLKSVLEAERETKKAELLAKAREKKLKGNPLADVQFLNLK